MSKFIVMLLVNLDRQLHVFSSNNIPYMRATDPRIQVANRAVKNASTANQHPQPRYLITYYFQLNITYAL